MMGASYTTKKELKLAIGKPLSYVETTLMSQAEFKPNGTFCVVGPCAYTNRKWYASVTMENGVIKKVS